MASRPHRRPRPLVVLGSLLMLAAAACSDSTTGDPVDAARNSTTDRLGPAVSSTTVVSIAAVSTTTSIAPTTTAGRPLRWVALGDSYSAGIGASTPEQKVSPGCDRDPLSNYPILAAATLTGRSQPIDLDVRACDGATIRQIIDAQSADVSNADIITLTLGGNDFGFSRVLTDCLVRGCRSYDQPEDRFPGFAHEPNRTDWEILEQRATEALAALAPKLAPGGSIFVLTYPLPFPANPDQPCLDASAALNDVSRFLANAAIERLDQMLISAASSANAAARSPYVTVVDWRTGLDRPLRPTTDASGVERKIRDNPNGICSADPMLQGIASTEFSDSFHPTDRGMRYAADAVAAAVASYAATR